MAGGAIALKAAGDTQQAVAAGLSVAAKKKAAEAAQKKLQEAQASNIAMGEEERNRQLTLQQPYMAAGAQAVGDLSSYNIREAQPYQMQTFGGVDMSTDPGVAYRMEQANTALESSAANRGNLFSGKTAKDLAELNQNLASQEYANAYQRQYGQFQDEEQARREQANIEANRMLDYDQANIAQLQGLTNVGQTGATTYGGASRDIYGQVANRDYTMRGYGADLAGTIAGAPLEGASAVNMTLGKGASSAGSFFGGSGQGLYNK